MGTDDPTILLQALPEELQSFEVQAQPGARTTRVAVGLAEARLKAAKAVTRA